MRFTKSSVNALRIPQSKLDFLIFDDQLPGFGLRIRQGGKRTWVVQYRVGEKQRRVTIGTVVALDPEEARKKAREVLAQVQLGGDPQLEKKTAQARAHESVSGIIDAYLKHRAEPTLGMRTVEEVRRSLKTHWKPIHGLPSQTLKRSAVAARLQEIATENGPYASNRARAYLSAMFKWAIEQGIAEVNPVVGTGKVAKEVARERVLSNSELARIWHQAGNGDYGNILKLLILTGQRRQEVAAMNWNEINFEISMWTIPGSRTKNGKPHDVPLSSEAIKVLKSIQRDENRSYIFGTGEGPFSGWSKAKAGLDKMLKLTPWRLHDLRRTTATGMAELGVQPHVIESVLNHLSGHRAGVAGVYNRAVYALEKQQAMSLWAAHVAKIDSSARGSRFLEY